MKRILFTALLVMVLAASASAQSYQQPYQKFGIKGGLNIFKYYGNDVGDVGSLTSYAMGFSYSYHFNELFALGPELFYSKKGWKIDELKMQEGYVEIPVLFKVSFPIAGSEWKPNLSAGPYLAFLIGAKLGEVDVKDQLNSTDAGLVVGAGVDLEAVAGQSLSFEFRYSIGFTKVMADDTEAFNNGFQFLLGYGYSM
jgi:opacity protein-like surface antigen